MAQTPESFFTALRSLLFVPADSERKFAQAITTSGYALVLDLKDSVSVERLQRARELMAELCARAQPVTQQQWVHVNSLQSGLVLADLACVIEAATEGIVIRKISNLSEVLQFHRQGLEEVMAPSPLTRLTLDTNPRGRCH